MCVCGGGGAIRTKLCGYVVIKTLKKIYRRFCSRLCSRIFAEMARMSTTFSPFFT